MAEAGSVSSTRPGGVNSPLQFVPVVVYCVGLCLLFNETLSTLVGIWESSATYKHGFIIAPISLWLIWGQRDYLRALPVRPVVSPLLLSLLVGPVWLLADLIDVNVVKQFAFIALLITGIWSLLGHHLARAIAFPLGFLFFAVPVGDDLVPLMMEFTATSTVALVKWTGIPVYREGMYFMLPSGSWSVVYACSGMRYLIAAVTLGVLYAYLTYRSLRRRLIFSAVSVVVPIFANSARAYMIVMLGHISGMKIATGVDHLLYGWVFFGIVMFILFWIGAIWREDLDDDARPFEEDEDGARAASEPGQSANAWVVLAMSLCAMSVWPGLALAVNSLEPRAVSAQMVAPKPAVGWAVTADPAWEWRPVHRGPDRELAAFYRGPLGTVAIFVAQYLRQEEGEELVSGLDLTPKDAQWRLKSRDDFELRLHGANVSVERKQLELPGKELLALSWFRIGEQYTAHPYIAKALELKERLALSDLGSARITVVTDVPAANGGDKLLQEFIDTYLPHIEAMLGDGLRE